LLVGGLVIGTIGVSLNFGGMLIFYVAVTTLYSTVLKRMLLLDVYMLAGLFTFRILAGAVAVEVRPSEWLLAFSMFIFTSLAMVKRCSELKTWSKMDKTWVAGRGYTVSDMQLLRSAGMASAFAAVLVFALYISSPAVTLLYRRPEVLWSVCPILMYWLTRLWFLTNREKLLEDPVLFALTDRVSIACGILVGLLVAVAT
jgi:4-hydroxybenzoate polyprenyltransferase